MDSAAEKPAVKEEILVALVEMHLAVVESPAVHLHVMHLEQGGKLVDRKPENIGVVERAHFQDTVVEIVDLRVVRSNSGVVV